MIPWNDPLIDIISHYNTQNLSLYLLLTWALFSVPVITVALLPFIMAANIS